MTKIRRTSKRNYVTNPIRSRRRVLSQIEKKKCIHLLLTLIMLSVGYVCSYPRTKSLLSELRYLQLPTGQKRNLQIRKLRMRHFDWEAIDIYEETGLFGDDFEDLLEEVKPKMEYGSKKLNERDRLFMCFHWLRHYPDLRYYEYLFGVSKATAKRIIKADVIVIYAALRKRTTKINFPDDWSIHAYNFDGIIVYGAIDCTSHVRTRVHPGQSLWYRGDKRFHFITAEVICSIEGDRIYAVFLGLGHNNDQGMWKKTMKDYCESNDITFLADMGYRSCKLVRPDKYTDEGWSKEQCSLRSVVEVVCGLAQQWAICGEKCKEAPEFQEVCLMVCWEIVNFYLKQFPLGNDRFLRIEF